MVFLLGMAHILGFRANSGYRLICALKIPERLLRKVWLNDAARLFSRPFFADFGPNF